MMGGHTVDSVLLLLCIEESGTSSICTKYCPQSKAAAHWANTKLLHTSETLKT